jgi:ferredoxin
MKAVIAKRGCLGCGLCTDICPTVFKMTEKAFSMVYVEEIPAEDAESATMAKKNCPAKVIKLVE